MPEESVRIMCPNLLCRKVLAVPQGARGKTVRCRACSTAIRIPVKAGEKPAEKPAESPADRAA
jgi:LSD1 subclass zinc finger protein